MIEEIRDDRMAVALHFVLECPSQEALLFVYLSQDLAMLPSVEDQLQESLLYCGQINVMCRLISIASRSNTIQCWTGTRRWRISSEADMGLRRSGILHGCILRQMWREALWLIRRWRWCAQASVLSLSALHYLTEEISWTVTDRGRRGRRNAMLVMSCLRGRGPNAQLVFELPDPSVVSL